MKSLFQYFGGKSNQLNDIYRIIGNHLRSFDFIVDVFGGSGKVLLNIPDEWKKKKVYNDLNDDLYATFKVLQDVDKCKILEEKLKRAFLHEKIFTEMKNTMYDNDIDTAFKVFYLHNNSFMGTGDAFGRRFQYHMESKYAIENFICVKDWIVEHQDFRELMRIYAKPKVLFYLDPPYLTSGTQYEHSFTNEDLKDLGKLMNDHPGSYLLNLSLFDHGMEDIFGKPDRIINYTNPLVTRSSDILKTWQCGYWWKFGNKKTITYSYDQDVLF